MPTFGSPFSGLANNKKLTKDELIRAVRFTVAAEFEATQLYMQLSSFGLCRHRETNRSYKFIICEFFIVW